MNLTANLATSKAANFRRRNFIFWNRIPVASQRIPAGTVHAERNKEPFTTLLLQVLARKALQNNSKQNARRVAVVKISAGRLLKLICIQRIQNTLCRQRAQIFHRHAVIQTVRKQVKNTNIFAVICL